MALTTELFVVRRGFDASRRRVWEAFTGALERWFAPKGFKIVGCTLDLRPGGTFHYQLLAPDGSVIWGKWVFREIVEPERLVFTVAFSDATGGVTRHPWAADWPMETLSTIAFADDDGRTNVTLEWRPLDATEAERRAFDAGHDGMRQGWAGTFDHLDEFLATH